MGYSLTTLLAPPSARSHASPKTHVPLPRLQERGHRYYSPEVGRWLNRDPLCSVWKDPTSRKRVNLTPYVMTHNDLIVNTDPLGKDIYLVRGSDEGAVNNIVHHSVCVDTWLPGEMDRLAEGENVPPSGRSCMSFMLHRIGWKWPSTHWLGFPVPHNASCAIGRIYAADFPSSGHILSTRATTWRQSVTYFQYMGRRRDEDVYSLAFFNCVTFSLMEFAAAESHIGQP
jgi:RHS repeat-associated protein